MASAFPWVVTPVAKAATNNGYVPTKVLISKVLPFTNKSSKYGGVMLWNKYFNDQSGYSDKIKSNV